ncbi:MAG: sulfurtransferase TusA family protein [Dehalococcoidia bacterium]|nr:sulfurtransferase TusA family protein [Dehalococcoidales bacterium]MDZ4246579.1 sulfurtransferase TusA family protein [Dehalococcoidia bacterium]
MAVITEYDLSGFVCPLSKVKAIQLLESLEDRETAKIILGDSESLKSVAQELKSRGLKPAFEQNGGSKFTLTVTK